MRAAEVREVGRLAGEAVGGFATFVGLMHEGIAERTFRALGPLGIPTRVVHERATRAIYPTVHKALRAGPVASAGALARRTPADALPASASRTGSLALAALNGAIGDALERNGSELALTMTARHGEEATPKLAVFVHGLCQTDDAWSFFGNQPSYGDRLAAEHDYTPVYVRYNTGLHISDNGRNLSELIAHLTSEWPVAVEEITLVGHSMGGLVCRSAAHQGEDWTEKLRHVFCLGTPHLGAPLEKAANAAGWAFGRLPETRAFAKLVNGRSVGIKDLRFGSCAEADWCDCDPDEFLKDRCQDVPFLETATYYFVGATVSKSENALLGDLLVRYPSGQVAPAAGASRSRSTTACTSAAPRTSTCSTTQRCTSSWQPGSLPRKRAHRHERADAQHGDHHCHRHRGVLTRHADEGRDARADHELEHPEQRGGAPCGVRVVGEGERGGVRRHDAH
jgi:pimeloyl-ACP methyl ester carboxylesterase